MVDDAPAGAAARRRIRPLHALLLGQSVSALGDWIGTIALIALVLELSGSATAVGAALVLRIAPTAFAGPLAVRAARRWSRRGTMLAMDAVRVPAAALLPWVRHLGWVYLWAFVIELAGIVFLTARDASVPDLLEHGDDLATTNGLVLATSYGAIPFGAGAFALVSWLAGGDSLHAARIVFTLDAATFVLSFLAVSRLPRLETEDRAATPASDRRARFVDALRLPIVRRLGPAAVAVAAGLGALFSVGIVWVREVLDASDAEFGAMVACFGAGAAVALGVLRFVRRRDLVTVRALLVVQGVVVASMSLAPVIGLALLGAVAFGALAAAVLALAMELLQRDLADRARVMAFTAFHVLIRASLAVAAIAAGIADDLLHGSRWPVVGHLESAQIVLFSSGVLVVVAAIFTGRAAPPAPEPRPGTSDRRPA
jgi:MFS family permease